MHLAWQEQPVGGLHPQTIPTSVLPEEAAALARMAKDQDVLEIGSAFGYSAIVMALGGARSVTAVDPHDWLDSLPVMTANLLLAGAAGKVTILRHASQDVLPGMAAAGTRFGFIFIDGDHAGTQVGADVNLALPLLAAGGTLACHDREERCCCREVAPALDEILGEPDKIIGSMGIYAAAAARAAAGR